MPKDKTEHANQSGTIATIQNKRNRAERSIEQKNCNDTEFTIIQIDEAKQNDPKNTERSQQYGPSKTEWNK